MDDGDRAQLATAFVNGLLEEDWDRVREVLHESTTWSLPGETGVSGLARGVDAVVARAQAIVSGGVSIELVRVLYGRNNVAVQLHNTGRRGDAVLDEQLTTVFTIVEDRIGPIETLISDVPGLNAFFAAAS